jgi:anti-sigma28 factor (negative regulator of flagellin synthesis)
MVAIQGISGVPEPKPERPSKVRETKEQAVTTSKAKDGVIISTEAQAAAQLARLVQTANDTNDVRTDKVEAARERMERGDYKNPEVVAKVAEKLSKYLP